jgi:predicted  nucleic acid-binding Zn-ribbon protein
MGGMNMPLLPASTLTNLRTDLKKAEERKAALNSELSELEQQIKFIKKIVNDAEKVDGKTSITNS